MKTLKMYAGKKYQYLNEERINNIESIGYKVIKVIGSHILIMTTDRNNYKRLINHTANNAGSIIITTHTINKHSKEPVLCCSWVCDSWAMPNKAMAEYLDENKFELFDLIERSA